MLSALGTGSAKNQIAVALKSMGGLTFFKDFSKGLTSVDADYAAGSATGTWTVTRSASTPATYVDHNGLVQIKTDTTPRFTSGFYDSTGFVSRPGLIVEGAATNLIPKSSVIDDATWTESNTIAENADAGSTSPDGTATAPSLTAIAANGTLLLTTNVTAQTYSVWLKRKTGTGTINITANGGTGWTEVTVTSSWTRHQVTVASAAQACGIRIVTDADAVYVWGNQFEASPFATTYIPTTTAALTRNAESLSYVIAGNRTADTETCFVRATPFWTGTNVARNTYWLNTDTKQRVLYATTADEFILYSNFQDSVLSTINGTTVPQKYTSYTMAEVFYGAAADVNAQLYLNGVLEGTTSTNYIENPWGTNFQVGSNGAGAENGDSIFQSIAIFSDAKGAADVLAISNLMAAA